MNIIKFEVRRSIKSSLLWALVCSGIIIFFMSLYPSMENSDIQEIVFTKLDAFSEGLMEAFGLDNMVDFTNIMQYLAYTIQYISMAIGVYALILGINALLSEEVEGTIEFLYAQPVCRNKIVLTKLLSNAYLLFQSIFIIGLFTIAVSIFFKPEDYDLINLIMGIKEVFLGICLVAYTYFSIGFFLSSILKPKVGTTSISIGIFFFSYIVGVVSRLKEELELLRFLSPFDYVLPMDLVRYGWERKFLVAAIIIMVLTIAASFFIYDKKDMEI